MKGSNLALISKVDMALLFDYQKDPRPYAFRLWVSGVCSVQTTYDIFTYGNFHCYTVYMWFVIMYSSSLIIKQTLAHTVGYIIT